MRLIKSLFSAVAVVGLCAVAAGPVAPAAQAQISIGLNFGNPPSCPYGYYDYAPYNCAPYGYYGPEWFNGGVFIGAGHWFHGPKNFHGSVNNSYDPRHGYHGAMPSRGSHAQHAPAMSNFHGNETHDSGGHVMPQHGGGHDNHGH